MMTRRQPRGGAAAAAAKSSFRVLVSKCTVMMVAFTAVLGCALQHVVAPSSSSSASASASSSSSSWLMVDAYTPTPPPKISPATNRPNQLYKWRKTQQIRYQQAGPVSGDPVLLVHGLFVNSDHWRKTLLGLAEEGYNVYAIDLWGYGYSSKPPYDSPEAQAVNGETGRAELMMMLKGVELGTSNGKGVRIRDIDLKHPVSSPYNFYTWSALICDFAVDVMGARRNKQVTLVCNSIGTSSALQAVIDKPDLFTGVCVVTPNFRELHSAEVPLSRFSMPLIRRIQKALRENGQPLFDALATPSTVKQILKEPYKVQEAIDDTLVEVLLAPLLLEGASNVVFDTLSYSAGPLPEQQLSMFPKGKPVWITYGTADPWTPEARVDALANKDCVEKVVPLPGIGHCPHDECPELVNPFILDFLQRVKSNKKINGGEGGGSMPDPSALLSKFGELFFAQSEAV